MPVTVADKNLQLLDAIVNAQSAFTEGGSVQELFATLLENLLSLTNSEYGFIGEIKTSVENNKYLKTHAITNIAWNAETLRFYEENITKGLEFTNLDTLFGYVIKTGEPLITNQPSIHPHAAGIPSGHPALNSFLGLPFYGQGEFVGMVGIANRPEGYDDLICEFLKPFLNTCSNIILSLRHKNAYEETLLELTKSRHQIEREKGLEQELEKLKEQR